MKLLPQITAAVELGRAGDQETARTQLTALWDEGDAWDRCTIAHFLADLQETSEDELTWDLRALEALHEADTDGPYPAEAMLPSLHLSLADDYRRLHETAKAEAHLAEARAHLGALSDDAYGDIVRSGFEHVADALAAGSTERLATNPST